MKRVGNVNITFSVVTATFGERLAETEMIEIENAEELLRAFDYFYEDKSRFEGIRSTLGMLDENFIAEAFDDEELSPGVYGFCVEDGCLVEILCPEVLEYLLQFQIANLQKAFRKL